MIIDQDTVDVTDVQGFLIRGYNFRHSKYIVLNITKGNVESARAFCAALLPGSGAPMNITNAETWPANSKPEYCLNIGFTYYGLELLINSVNCKTVANASNELFPLFKRGAADLNNCIQVGDTDGSAPSNWWKTGGWMLPTNPKADGSDLHIQLTLFAKDPVNREVYYNRLLAMIPEIDGQPTLVPAFVKDSDPVAPDPDVIHFGYKDSISQPRLDNVGDVTSDTDAPDDRPKVPANRFIINGTANPAPNYHAHGLLKNGTFAAFRFLYQDVGAFNDFIVSDPNTPADLVAAKMCGRWFDGTPLVVSPEGTNARLSGNDNNNFNYLVPTEHQKGPRKSDDLGAMCPYAAHIRRSNPRDDFDVKGNDQNNEPLQIHRVLRRASPYGPPYVKDEPISVQRGLIGLFIGAKLSDQFQFIMNQWIESGGFRTGGDKSPNASGVDPLFGVQISDHYPPDQEFDYCDNAGNYKQMKGLTRFIRTDGAMYLFLPGIEGLKYISQGTIPQA